MVSPQSDEDLVTKVIGGEEDAFSQIYERYMQRVYATAYRVVQNPAEAQDATQEIFFKIYRSLPDWDPRKASFSTWLYRLSVNHAIDCWRALRRRRESQPEEDSGRDPFPERSLGDAIITPMGALENREGIEQIRECVQDLPDLQKKVFLLRYFHELKLEEIAALEQCSLGTVKTSLFRATHAVRRAVRRAGGYR